MRTLIALAVIVALFGLMFVGGIPLATGIALSAVAVAVGLTVAPVSRAWRGP